MAYKLELFKAAEDDLEDALDYYLEETFSTAQKFFDAYLEILDRIANNPFQFPKAKGKIRKARFSKPFPYNAYFFIDDEIIFITAIFHDKRNPKIWKERTS